MVSDPIPLAAAVPATLLGALVGAMTAGPHGFLVGGLAAGAIGAFVTKHLLRRTVRP